MPHTELQELTAMGGQQERPADVYSDFISEEDVDAICRVLKKQRDGLQHLTDILTLVFIQNSTSYCLLSFIFYHVNLSYAAYVRTYCFYYFYFYIPTNQSNLIDVNFIDCVGKTRGMFQ